MLRQIFVLSFLFLSIQIFPVPANSQFSSSSSTGTTAANSGSINFNSSFLNLPFPNRSRSACSSDGKTLFVGGGFDGFTPSSEFWRLNLTSFIWSRANSTNFPSNFGGGLSSKFLGQSIIHFGGLAGLATNDVYASLDNGESWSRTDATAPWSARSDFASVTLPNTNIVLIIGGAVSNSGPTNLFNASDVWISTDGIGIAWHQQSVNPIFGAIIGGSAVALLDHSVVLTGGLINGSYSSNVYISYDVGKSWQLQSTGGFTARSHHSAVVDSSQIIYLIGGRNSDLNNFYSAAASNDRGRS